MDAREKLGEAVVAAVMAAERAGLSEREIADVVTGELVIRPGYPAVIVCSCPACK
jgi:hypothetical protein